MSPFYRILLGVLAFAVVIGTATLGYVWAGFDFLDSLYMVIITVFAVGYDEVIPIAESPWMRLLTMGIIVAGTTTVVYTVGATLQFMTQGEIERLIGARRKMRDINAMEGHTIVCGFGRMGQILARDLASEKHPLVIVEADPAHVAQAEAAGYLVLQGNATDEDTLVDAGIARAAHIACILPSDADNVFVALSARNLQPDIHIVARGEVPSTEGKLRQAGAHHVVLPPSIGGSRIAELIMEKEHALRGEPDRMKVVHEGPDETGISLCAFQVMESGGTLAQWLDSARRQAPVPFVVVGVRDTGKVLRVDPGDAHELRVGEEIMLGCATPDAPVLRAKLQSEATPA